MKETFTREEVITLLKEQRRRTASSLGFSSKSFLYPKDFHEMRAWMENSGLVLNDEITQVNYPQCPFSQIVVHAPTMHIKTCDVCAKQGYPLVDIKTVDGKLIENQNKGITTDEEFWKVSDQNSKPKRKKDALTYDKDYSENTTNRSLPIEFGDYLLKNFTACHWFESPDGRRDYRMVFGFVRKDDPAGERYSTEDVFNVYLLKQIKDNDTSKDSTV